MQYIVFRRQCQVHRSCAGLDNGKSADATQITDVSGVRRCVPRSVCRSIAMERKGIIYYEAAIAIFYASVHVARA